MTKINRLPQGLQSALASKSVGQNPDNLLQDVRPSVDMFQFWLAEVAWDATRQVDLVVTTTGTHGVIEVPAGELWYVHMITSQITNQDVAGNEVVWAPQIRASLLVVPAGRSNIGNQFSSLLPGDTEIVSADLPFPLFFRAGDQFSTGIFRTVPVGSNNLDVTTSVIYKKLEI